MKKFQKFIVKGVLEPMQYVPFHTRAPFKRYSMLSKKKIPNSNTHIAIHAINKIPKKLTGYSTLHKHDTDEINLIISEKGRLTYEIQLEDEKFRVSSPATIFIPKNTLHKARAISGKGTFVCIILSSNYKTK